MTFQQLCSQVWKGPTHSLGLLNQSLSRGNFAQLNQYRSKGKLSAWLALSAVLGGARLITNNILLSA